MDFPKTYAVLEAFGQKLAEDYKSLLQMDSASGKLYDSVQTQVIAGDTALQVTITLEDYWKYTEEGRNPGTFPNLDAIREWVRIKPILPSPFYDGKLPTQDQLAFLIGRKIKEDGIPARPYMEMSIESALAEFEAKIEEALAEDIQGDVFAFISSTITKNQFKKLIVK